MPDVSPLGSGPAPFSPTVALLTLARLAETRLAALLEPHELNVRKFGVLGHVAAHPGLSLSELARRSRITVQSLHTIIGSLAAAGLVVSETEVTGRPARVTVTPAGTALLEILRGELAALDDDLFHAEGWGSLPGALGAAVDAMMRARRAGDGGTADL